MASHHASILILALLFLATNPLRALPTSSPLINGLTISQVRIGGLVVCSATGNPVQGTNAPGLAEVSVSLVCDGSQSSVAQALTDPSGFFTVISSTADGLIFDPSTCSINVNLPVGNCTILPPTGILTAVPSLIDVVQGVVSGVLGNVAVYTVEGLFSLVG